MKVKSNSFKELVLATVRSIPKGQTRSYGEVATIIGHPGAARAVGTLMKNNYDKGVPCHRVIKADGSVGAYNRGGRERKMQLLKQEGAI